MAELVEVPTTGLAFLALLVLIWLMLDFLRIARVRRMLKAIEKHDIEKMQKLADAGIKNSEMVATVLVDKKKKNTKKPKTLGRPLRVPPLNAGGAVFC